MTGRIVVQKAGQAAAKAVAGQAANSGAAITQVPLRPPRAVTAAEAPSILPARESTKTTMMPWKGWFDRFLKDNLSADTYRKMRTTLFFMPDDIYDLQQSPIPNQKIPAADPKYTHMYRYPSPGSQEPASLPEFDLETNEDPYDSNYFKRDTRRRYESSELPNPVVEKMKLAFMDENDPRVQEGACVCALLLLFVVVLLCLLFACVLCELLFNKSIRKLTQHDVSPFSNLIIVCCCCCCCCRIEGH